MPIKGTGFINQGSALVCIRYMSNNLLRNDVFEPKFCEWGLKSQGVRGQVARSACKCMSRPTSLSLYNLDVRTLVKGLGPYSPIVVSIFFSVIPYIASIHIPYNPYTLELLDLSVSCWILRCRIWPLMAATDTMLLVMIKEGEGRVGREREREMEGGRGKERGERRRGEEGKGRDRAREGPVIGFSGFIKEIKRGRGRRRRTDEE